MFHRNPNSYPAWCRISEPSTVCPSHSKCIYSSNRVINRLSWLVVWNMNFMIFHSVGNFIIPTDELHHFSEGRSTTNQLATILGPNSQNLGDALFWDGSQEVELSTEVRLNEPRANHHSGIGPNPCDAKITIVDGSIIPPFQMVKSQPKMADVEMKWELSAN